MFILIILSVFQSRGNVQQLEKSRYQKAKEGIFIAISLSTVFGLGWGLGLAATSTPALAVTSILQILFSILISSQGLLLFLLHGVRSADFRTVWKKSYGKLCGRCSSGFKRLYTVTSASSGPNPSASGETASASSVSTLLRNKIASKGGQFPNVRRGSENCYVELSHVSFTDRDENSECKKDLSSMDVLENEHASEDINHECQSGNKEVGLSKEPHEIVEISLSIPHNNEEQSFSPATSNDMTCNTESDETS